jgi:hypothetical protein
MGFAAILVTERHKEFKHQRIDKCSPLRQAMYEVPQIQRKRKKSRI